MTDIKTPAVKPRHGVYHEIVGTMERTIHYNMGRISNNNGPAMIELDRERGYSIVRYCVGGHLHRTDGPAIIRQKTDKDGHIYICREYYHNGIRYGDMKTPSIILAIIKHDYTMYYYDYYIDGKYKLHLDMPYAIMLLHNQQSYFEYFHDGISAIYNCKTKNLIWKSNIHVKSYRQLDTTSYITDIWYRIN